MKTRINTIKIDSKTRLKVKTVEELYSEIKKNLKEEFGIEIESNFMETMRYKEVSNSHSSPLNGVTNWEGKEDKPTSYRGWSAWVRGKITKGEIPSNHSFGLTDGIKIIRGLHTGTFNGASQEGDNWSGSIYFFLDDFPNLVECIKDLDPRTYNKYMKSYTLKEIEKL